MDINGASAWPETERAPASVWAPESDLTAAAIQQELAVGTMEARTGAVRVRKIVSRNFGRALELAKSRAKAGM